MNAAASVPCAAGAFTATGVDTDIGDDMTMLSRCAGARARVRILA